MGHICTMITARSAINDSSHLAVNFMARHRKTTKRLKFLVKFVIVYVEQ